MSESKELLRTPLSIFNKHTGICIVDKNGIYVTGFLDKDVAEKIIEACNAHEKLVAENGRLKKLLERFIDDEPCSLDHHGYCQTHDFTEGGCGVSQAKQALEETREVKP
jgi:hypothetical protein